MGHWGSRSAATSGEGRRNCSLGDVEKKGDRCLPCDLVLGSYPQMSLITPCHNHPRH